MYANTDTANAPSCNAPAAGQPDRRQAPVILAGHRIETAALTRFNNVLWALGRLPLELRDLPTLARKVAPADGKPAPADWIGRRLRRGLSIGLMLADPTWQPANDCGRIAGIVMDYLRSRDDLIPDEIPRVGRLDDALVVDAAWPQLRSEVEDYLDFCRLRRIEAERQRCSETELRFTRVDWQAARRNEQARAAIARKPRLGSYLPSPGPALFRVR